MGLSLVSALMPPNLALLKYWPPFHKGRGKQGGSCGKVTDKFHKTSNIKQCIKEEGTRLEFEEFVPKLSKVHVG